MSKWIFLFKQKIWKEKIVQLTNSKRNLSRKNILILNQFYSGVENLIHRYSCSL